MLPLRGDRGVAARSGGAARRLRILSSRLVDGIFAGEYRSVFRGRGIEFEEVREYQPGDDVRGIDWNVTARMGRPFVKRYIEEREMTVMLLLDLSSSMNSPSPAGRKSDQAAEVCALLAFAAARSNDRVGLLAFSDRVEAYIPPGKGGRHAQRVVSEVLRPVSGRRGTNLAMALDYLSRVQRRACILFVVSDFLSPEYRVPLAASARRNDVVAVVIADPLDHALPDAGMVETVCPESGIRRLVDTGNPEVLEAYRRQAEARVEERTRVFAGAGADTLAVTVGAPPVFALAEFFRNRQQRRRR